MTRDPNDVLEFLQALLAGGVVLDREDPSHVERLQSACRLIEELRAVAHLVPEIERSGAELSAIEGELVAGGQSLLQRIGLLEELYSALDGHLSGLRRRAARVGSAPAVQEPAEAFEGIVAIDLGTSNAALATWDLRVATRPELHWQEPVAVNVLDAAAFQALDPQGYLTGEEALTHPSAVNLYRSFRRLLGGKQSLRPAVTRTDMAQVQASTLVAALLRGLLRRLARSLGREHLRFPQLVLTVPARGDLALEYELRRACEALGLRASLAVDEASAACVQHLLHPLLVPELVPQASDAGLARGPAERYARELGVEPRVVDPRAGKLALEANVLCVDTGGGTTDLALLDFTLHQAPGGCQVHIAVRDTTGFPELSGEGLTLHLFGLLKRRLALALTDPRRALLGARGDEPPRAHPWLELHRLEAGPRDRSLEARLEEDLRLVHEQWDALHGAAPLKDAWRAAVDRLFPTVTTGAARGGKKTRSRNFRWLWEEAERIKRLLAAERGALSAGREADDPVPTVRARLDLASCPRDPHGPDPEDLLRAAGVDPARPPAPEALGVSSRELDAWVAAAAAPLRAAVARVCAGTPIHRLLLAGGATHATRFVVEPLLRAELGLSARQVVFDPQEAKPAVARGACLWALGSRLEGVEVLLERQPRCPTNLWLVSAVGNELLWREGEAIDRFAYVQPPEREGAEGDKLILLAQEEGGRLEPFLVFDPRKGTPLPEVGDLPILHRRDLPLKQVDAFLQFAVVGQRTEWSVRDPGAYLSTDQGLIPHWELFQRLREEMSCEEVIAWIESSEHLRPEPAPEHAWHRYYLDETRELYLVFHARGKRLLCRGQVARQAREGLSEEQDPFSGVH